MSTCRPLQPRSGLELCSGSLSREATASLHSSHPGSARWLQNLAPLPALPPRVLAALPVPGPQFLEPGGVGLPRKAPSSPLQTATGLPETLRLESPRSRVICTPRGR